MSLLSRLLTARVSTALRPQPEAPASDVHTPTSLRMPTQLRGEMERIAERMGLSLHQVILMILTAFTEADPLAVQVSLMRERVRHLARSYRLDVMDMQRLIPALTPDTLANDDLLARALTPTVIAQLSETFAVSQRWMEGHTGSAAPSGWYDNRHDPVQWVERYGPDAVRVTWHAAQTASWLTIPAPNLMDSRVRNDMATEYAWHLGLIMEVRSARGPIYTLIHNWRDEKMDYHKARAQARAIATQLHDLGVEQYGMYVTFEQYTGLHDGTVLPSDLLRNRPLGSWEVADVLLTGQGLYAHEDR